MKNKMSNSIFSQSTRSEDLTVVSMAANAVRKNGLEDLWPIICFDSRRRDFLSVRKCVNLRCLRLERTGGPWRLTMSLNLLRCFCECLSSLQENAKEGRKKVEKRQKNTSKYQSYSPSAFFVAPVKRKIFSMAFSIIEKNIISLSWLFLSLLKSLSAFHFPAGNRFIDETWGKLSRVGKIVLFNLRAQKMGLEKWESIFWLVDSRLTDFWVYKCYFKCMDKMVEGLQQTKIKDANKQKRFKNWKFRGSNPTNLSIGWKSFFFWKFRRLLIIFLPKATFFFNKRQLYKLSCI